MRLGLSMMLISLSLCVVCIHTYTEFVKSRYWIDPEEEDEDDDIDDAEATAAAASSG